MMLPHDLGNSLSANLAPAYLIIFLGFVGLEALLGQPQPAAAASPRRALVNFGTLVLTMLLASLVPFSNLAAARLVEQSHIGLFQQVALPAPLLLLAALLTHTGLGYGLHRLSHGLPLLWRLHRCHHSDSHFDVSLALRHHPLELLPGLIVFPLGTAVMGLPLWAVAMVELVLIIANCCEHAAIRLPAGANRLLGTLFVTPALHLIHHSAEQAQANSNFGSLLTLWDRLFGTFRDPATTKVTRIGLGDADDLMAADLLAQLALPFSPGGPGHQP